MSKQKVRIKVLIDNTGNYCGYGWRGAGDSEPDETLYSVIEADSTAAFWITAELPIPNSEVGEVAAEIEKSDG